MGTSSNVIRQLNSSREKAAKKVKEDNERAEAFQAASNAREFQINEFMKSCGAIDCTVDAYAHWLAVWINQGGAIDHYSSHHFTGHYVNWLMPTRSTKLSIPAALGAQAFQLLIISDGISIPIHHTYQDRDGWEWGHSTVHRLKKTNGTWVALTNHPDMVECYPDIDKYIRLHEEELLKR